MSDLLDKKVLETASLNVALISKMHDALVEIVTTEPGLDGGITAREIARDTLVACQKMADETLSPIRPLKIEFVDDEQPPLTPSAGAAFQQEFIGRKIDARFWKCRCESLYIHVLSKAYCRECGADQENGRPPSIAEILMDKNRCLCSADALGLMEEKAHAAAA